MLTVVVFSIFVFFDDDNGIRRRIIPERTWSEVSECEEFGKGLLSHDPVYASHRQITYRCVDSVLFLPDVR